MTQENTKLCDFSNTNNNDFIGTPIAPPATSAESCDINTALLNLVMKINFPVLLMRMARPILIPSWNYAICKIKKMWTMMWSRSRLEKAVGVSEAVSLRLVPRRCLSALGAP